MGTGIICKLWNISGDSPSKSEKAQLTDSLSYILNSEKTDLVLDMKGSIFDDPQGQLERECKYVANDIKTLKGAYVGGWNILNPEDTRSVVKQMMEVKDYYGKTDGRAALHGIISLDETESSKENASYLMMLCQDMLKDLFPEHQAVFAVHTNTDHLHIHFIINSVGINSKKIHQDNRFISDVLHPCLNKLAEKYGFTPNDVWKKTTRASQKADWSVFPYARLKVRVRKDIDIAIENASDFNDFLDHMRTYGYTVNVGKYISVKSDDMTKALRTHQLGSSYTLDAIVNRIATRKEAFEHIDMGDYALNKKVSDVYSPNIVRMKKYKDMNDEEKKKVVHQLKLGKNPWRENQQMNWQLTQIADRINTKERVSQYVKFYSDDNTLEGALDGILEAKKQIMAEKKIIAQRKRLYKPIIDIYEEMQKIEKKSYLYEHENIEEYRSQFEHYRLLTRRLKNAYNKDVIEVAAFLDECNERLLYAHAQLNELSQEYREIKRYARENGINVGLSTDFRDMVTAQCDNLYYYIVAKESDVIIKVDQTSSSSSSKIGVEVLTKTGGYVIEENTVSKLYDRGSKELTDRLRYLKEKYNLNTCSRFSDLSSARDFVTANQDARNGTEKAEASFQPKKDTLSFTQAINHCGKAEKNTCVIIDTKMSVYMAFAEKKDDCINISIYDRDSKLLEMVEVPLLANKSNDGYETIINLQKKYGFSDELMEFNELSEARQYIDSKKEIGRKGKLSE